MSELVDVRVRRARNKRVTGWIVDCAVHQLTSPVIHSKSRAVSQAQLHAADKHDGRCRIISPR